MTSFLRRATLCVVLALPACVLGQPEPAPDPSPDPNPAIGAAPDASAGVDLARATKVTLWATRYYLYEAEPGAGAGAVPLRDMRDRVIGPSLAAGDWCNAAIEGSVRVGGATYNYAGTRGPRQADCPAHRPSEAVRWNASPFPFGIGNRSNALVPFRTLACDQGTVRRSTPWLRGGYAAFGTRIYIPAARGVRLPDGTVHDGVFTCGDTGGLIFGNHVDVFVGAARGERDAARRDPFDFVRSRASATFDAYVLP